MKYILILQILYFCGESLGKFENYSKSEILSGTLTRAAVFEYCFDKLVKHFLGIVLQYFEAVHRLSDPL